MTPLWEASATVVAQAGGFGTGGLRQWILDNVFPLALLIIACVCMFLGGGQGNNRAIMKRVGGVFIGMAFVGLAITGAGINLSAFLAGLLSS